MQLDVNILRRQFAGLRGQRISTRSEYFTEKSFGGSKYGREMVVALLVDDSLLRITRAK